ncbi:MAG: polysaccharide deacetylase family protein [Clostridia bacterium]|nr:polysaccharide deacetylase family protein [Clostridia bacterium]
MRFAESGKKKAVTFSYDDGITQDIRLIELLNRYGLKCTFNLNSGLLGKPGILWREEQHISHYKIHPSDVKSVYEGHEVAVHTLTHPCLPDKDEEFIIHQVEDDRIALSELVGYEVVGMAYPCGPNDDRCASIIREHTGVKYARTVTDTDSFAPQTYLHRFKPNAYHLDFDRLDALTDRFLSEESDEPQIFYVWGHAYEMDYRPDYWVKLEDFFRRIAGHEDIFYGTNAEILL